MTIYYERPPVCTEAATKCTIYGQQGAFVFNLHFHYTPVLDARVSGVPRCEVSTDPLEIAFVLARSRYYREGADVKRAMQIKDAVGDGDVSLVITLVGPIHTPTKDSRHDFFQLANE